MILASSEPMCVEVLPERIGSKVEIGYIVTGIGEDNVDFTATVNDVVKEEFKQTKEATATIRANSMQPIKACWQKTDRKSKKINFFINHSLSELDEKADPDTIEGLGEKFDGLLLKLTEISNQIVSSADQEIQYINTSQETNVFLTWMSILKMFVVLIVCGGQVYFTTSFFSKGQGTRRSNTDINPFAKSAI